MKQPPPDFSGKTKVLFVSEGNPTALLLSRPKVKPLEFETCASALAWCQKHSIMMVYLPVNPAVN